MNTDDRAPADLIAEYNLRDLVGRLRDDAALSKERWASCKKIGDERGMTVASQIGDDCDEAAMKIDRIADRLEAFHAKPVVGERWTDGEWQRLLRIVHAAITENAPGGLTPGRIDVLADSVMHALDDDQAAALQSPPPVVSGEAKRPSHLSVIPVKGHPEKHAVYDAIMGDAIAVCPDEIAAQMVFDALTKADTPPVVEEGRREAMARIIEEARAKYREPTDWDYGALDACTRIERALVALTSVEGVGDEVREALNVIIKLLDMEGDTLSEAQQRANVIQAWTVAVGLRATLGAPHEG